MCTCVMCREEQILETIQENPEMMEKVAVAVSAINDLVTFILNGEAV